MNNNIIEIKGLTRRFGKTLALKDVDVSVPRGTVLGLVGENGAGKTTLIKHLLGLFKAQCGSVRVFGLDPIQYPREVLARIGFLSENREMPEWMTIRQYMTYTRAFYRAWDAGYADRLVHQFDLDVSRKIKHLSRGQRAKTGLLTALAYKPDLLLLDEPSSGLDPVVRRDMLGAIVRTIAEEGRTVVLSSHLLDEVERLAQTIIMIHRSRVILRDTMDGIHARYCRLTLRFDTALPSPPSLPGLLDCTGGPIEWSVICKQDIDQIKQAAADLNAHIVELDRPSLDDIFVAHVKADTSIPGDVS